MNSQNMRRRIYILLTRNLEDASVTHNFKSIFVQKTNVKFVYRICDVQRTSTFTGQANARQNVGGVFPGVVPSLSK